MTRKHFLFISLLTAMLSLTSVSIFAVPVNIPLHAGYMVQNVPEEFDNMEELQTENKSGFSYTVFPDSSNEFINITYSLDTEKSISIELVDLFGKRIKTILPKQNHQAGRYTLQIPVSDFSTGTFFLTISSANQTKTEKIIINK